MESRTCRLLLNFEIKNTVPITSITKQIKVGIEYEARMEPISSAWFNLDLSKKITVLLVRGEIVLVRAIAKFLGVALAIW